MGHYEYQWEDYDPVADKYTHGPKVWVSDNPIGWQEIEKKERRKKEQEDFEKEAKRSEFYKIQEMIDRIITSDDVKQAQNALNTVRRLSSEDKRILRERIEKKSEKIQMGESVDIHNAIYYAKARYRKKSLFWKMIHSKQKPSKIDFGSMDVEEINDLYKRR